MTVFTWPQLLPLLAVSVLLGFWQWFARGRPLALPLDHTGVKRGWPMDRLMRLFSLAPAGLLAVGILLLANPLVEGPPRYPTEVSNIQIVLDTSTSMNAAFGTRVRDTGNSFTRFDAAMEAIDQFTQSRVGDAFGLSIFTNKVIHWVPLTTDLSAIRLSTPFVRPGTIPKEWWDNTLIGNAITKCAELLEQRSEGDRMMIVITDGESQDIKGAEGTQIGQDLKAKNIVLYAISVRSEGASRDLGTICNMTGGKLYESGDFQGLQAVFKQIDLLQQARQPAAEPQWLENDKPFAIAGLCLLGMQLMAMLGLRYAPL
jgi:Ca-activated chloride channel family protein